MQSDALLLVLLIREAGLRSTLVARLSLAGVDLLTAEAFGDALHRRHAHRALVLVTDQSALDEMTADPRWSGIMLICPELAEPGEDPRLVRIAHIEPATAIVERLARWRASAA